MEDNPGENLLSLSNPIPKKPPPEILGLNSDEPTLPLAMSSRAF
jgi:hypothetical protein